MARKAQPIMATDEQYQQLLIIKRSLKMEKRYCQRAEIILLSLEGKTLDEIISTTGMSKPIINKWLQRFRTIGIEGLQDAPRRG